jgi:hypothetical protein
MEQIKIDFANGDKYFLNVHPTSLLSISRLVNNLSLAYNRDDIQSIIVLRNKQVLYKTVNLALPSVN